SSNRIFGNLTRGKCRSHQARICTDRQDIGVTFDATGQGDKGAGALATREGPGTPTRRQPASIRVDPYLEEFAGFVFLIELTVGNAGAGAHHLHVACHSTATVAETVLMADGTLAHIGNDFH